MNTPEIDRMRAVKDESQAIGEFIEWLGENGMHIGHYVQFEGYRDQTLVPVSKPIEQLLADHFDIDLNKVDAEKRAILKSIQEAS